AVDRDTFFVHPKVSKGNTRLFAGFMGDSEDESFHELPSKPIESLKSSKEKNMTSTPTSKSSQEEPIDPETDEDVQARSVGGSNATSTNDTVTVEVLTDPDQIEGIDTDEKMRSVNGSETGTTMSKNETMETN
ncbi:unnamed protein product, partial [Allacma fusca]